MFLGKCRVYTIRAEESSSSHFPYLSFLVYLKLWLVPTHFSFYITHLLKEQDKGRNSRYRREGLNCGQSQCKRAERIFRISN